MQNQSDVRRTITTKIIESLKQGRIPWRRPWKVTGVGVETPRLPTNLTTLKPYAESTSRSSGWPLRSGASTSNFWASYKQWQSVGSSVKKGEKATQIVFFKPIKKTVEQEDGSERLESFPLLRTFPVFSIHQVEGGVAEKFLNRPAKPIFETANRAEFDRMVEATGADIRYGGSRAVYSPAPSRLHPSASRGAFREFRCLCRDALP